MMSKQEVKDGLTAIHGKATDEIKTRLKNAITAKLAEGQKEIAQKNAKVLQNYNTLLQEIATTEEAEIAEVKKKYEALRNQAEKDRDGAYATVKTEAENKAKEAFDEFAPYIVALASAGKTLNDIPVVE